MPKSAANMPSITKLAIGFSALSLWMNLIVAVITPTINTTFDILSNTSQISWMLLQGVISLMFLRCNLD